MKKLVYFILLAVLNTLLFAYWGMYNYNRGFDAGMKQAVIQQKEEAVQIVTSRITYCESRNIHDRTSNKGAYGRAQFMKPTFNWMKNLAKHPELEWRNEKDQMWLLDWAVRNGYGSHWQTCYRQAVRHYVNLIPQQTFLMSKASMKANGLLASIL